MMAHDWQRGSGTGFNPFDPRVRGDSPLLRGPERPTQAFELAARTVGRDG